MLGNPFVHHPQQIMGHAQGRMAGDCGFLKIFAENGGYAQFRNLIEIGKNLSSTFERILCFELG